MTASGNDLVPILLAFGVIIVSGYLAGRVHQWYRTGLQRDGAYRAGYDHASRSMFDMAVRVPPPQPAVAAPAPARTPGLSMARHTRPVGLGRRRIVAHRPTVPDRRRRRAAL
ncbi:hypothetical protein EV385_1933 [Krasilnikovia cinnamomea]|uniref:Uncharacterized protein n=1 Tax=Krasilnikovia cinnamomea TaxID=349313 RepID=A0A4Q7ZHA7_9ACTN|nr:hypothetical protein [Krasilnikovia cinnamomea]RZU50168.1 hypothetical protein EV385_1933 [Krasilnikovia cinnamomea]